MSRWFEGSLELTRQIKWRIETGRGWTYVQRPTGYSARLANPDPYRGCFVRRDGP